MEPMKLLKQAETWRIHAEREYHGRISFAAMSIYTPVAG